MTPPVLPGYRFLEHLGSGGFADVFAYEQEWPRQRVAVKVVREDVALNERERAMFTSEANAMGRLGDHPFIVPVLTAGTTADHRPYLVMRYCPPPDLGVRVRSTPLSVQEAISTGIKLASAVETAHRVGMVHRDIKPSNVLVTSYNEPALTDFGIAGRLQEVAGDDEVRISYPWSPPEMLDGRSNGSVASDVYSLGATIWHLLVGRSPFSIPGGDNSTRALSARILHAAPPATQRPDVPPALDRLLQQTMAKQPAHRPDSAMDLALALQRIETAQGLSRTTIAVEGGQPAFTAARSTGGEDEDHTRVKPAAVPSASGPRALHPSGSPARGSGAPTDPEAPRAEPVRRPVLVSTIVGVVLLVALVGYLVTRGGDAPEPTPTPSAAASTPGDLVADGAPDPPGVSVRRVPKGALFTWTAAGGSDVSFQYQAPERGVEGRTQQRRLLVRATPRDRVCLQVRAIADHQASDWAEECAEPR
jgi:serine/threonine protein kinase